MPNSNKDDTRENMLPSEGSKSSMMSDIEMPERLDTMISLPGYDTPRDPLHTQLSQADNYGYSITGPANNSVKRSTSLAMSSSTAVKRTNSLAANNHSAGESDSDTATLGLPKRPALLMRRSITSPEMGSMTKALASVEKDKMKRSNTYDPADKVKRSATMAPTSSLLGYVPTSRHIFAQANVGMTNSLWTGWPDESNVGEEGDEETRSCWPKLCPDAPHVSLDDDNCIDDESDEEGHYTYQQLDQLTHREHTHRKRKSDIAAMDHDEVDILNRDDTVIDEMNGTIRGGSSSAIMGRAETMFQTSATLRESEYLKNKIKQNPGATVFGEALQYAVLKQQYFIWKYNYHDMVRVWCACKGRIWPWRVLLIIIAYDLIWVGANFFFDAVYSLDNSMYNLFNLAVAFLLIFRAQQAFAAYRDARMKWEDIIWNSWEAQQMLCAHIHNRSLVELAGEHFIALSICAKNYLRSEKLELTKTELECVLDQDSLKAIIGTQNLRTIRGAAKRTQITQCLACLYALRRIIEISITHEQQKAEESGRKYRGLGIHIARIISPRLTEIHTSIAECNRISTTPMPYVYIVHLRFLVMILLLLLPPGVFGIFYSGGKPAAYSHTRGDCSIDPTDGNGGHNDTEAMCDMAGGDWTDGVPVFYTKWMICFWTLFWSAIVGYAILGLEELSNEMQNPLGWNRSNLPLELYVQIIQYQIKRLWRITYSSYGERFDDRLMQLCRDDDAADAWAGAWSSTGNTPKTKRRGSKTGDDCDDGGD